MALTLAKSRRMIAARMFPKLVPTFLPAGTFGFCSHSKIRERARPPALPEEASTWQPK